MCKKKLHDVPRFVDDTGVFADEANTLFFEFAKFMPTQSGLPISKWNNYFNWL